MQSNLKQILSSIDLLGVPIAINFSGKEKFRTHFGGVCTLFFFAFVIWALYNASQDFFTTVNPTTISSEEYYDIPRELYINSSTFPMAVGLLDPTLTPFHNESLFKVRYVYRILTKTPLPDGTVDEQWHYKNLTTERCRPDHFGELAWSFADLHLEHAYCMADHQPILNDSDSRVRIKGASTSSRYESIVILVQICNNATSDIVCGTPDEQEELLGGSFFNIFYGNTAINLKNSSRPDQRFKDLYYAMLSPTTYREAIVDLGRIEVNTDSGWIVPTESTTQYIKLNKIVESLYPEPNWEDILMACVLGVSKLENHHKRSYKKIADVLAEVGGLANSVLIVILISTGSFFQLKFREKLVNEMFDVSTYKDEMKKQKDKKNKKQGKSSQKQGEPGSKRRPSKDRQKYETPKKKVTQTANTLKTLKEEQPSEIMRPGSPTSEYLMHKSVPLSPLSSSGQSDNLAPQRKVNNVIPERLKRPKPSQGIRSQPEDEAQKDRKASNAEDTPISLNSLLQRMFVDDGNENGKQPAKPNRRNSKELASKFNSKYQDQGRSEDLEDPSFESKLKDINSKEASRYEIMVGDNNVEDEEPKKKVTYAQTINQEGITNQDSPSPDTHAFNKKRPSSEDEVDDFSKLGTGKKQKEKIDLSPWEYIVSFVYKTETVKYKLGVLSSGSVNIEERLDVMNMLIKLREIDKLKAMLLDKDQLALFGHLPKPQLKPVGAEEDKSEDHFRSNLLRQSTIKEGLKEEREIRRLLNKVKSKVKKTEIDERFLEVFYETFGKGGAS